MECLRSAARGAQRLALVREGLGLDLDDRVRRSIADRLDAIAAGFELDLAGDLALVDHEIAALVGVAADRRAAEQYHAVRARLGAEGAGNRAAARQRDLQLLR